MRGSVTRTRHRGAVSCLICLLVSLGGPGGNRPKLTVAGRDVGEQKGVSEQEGSQR